MLGLGQQVRGGKLRVGRIIREHQHFAGTGQQVNRHVPEQQPFRRHHVGIARSENFLRAPDRSRAVRHRRDGLRAPGAIDLRRSRRSSRVKQRRVDRAVPAARGADDNFRTTRDPRQRDRHQRGRDQGRRAAGNVNPDAPEGIEFFTDSCPLRVFRRPVFPERFPAEELDVFPRRLDRRAQSSIGPQRRRNQLRFGHRQLLRRQSRAVKTLGQFEQRRVAARENLLQNGARAFLDRRIEEAALGRERAKFIIKRFVFGPEDIHGAAKLEEGAGEVKTPGPCRSRRF